jgi:hypothetical protein
VTDVADKDLPKGVETCVTGAENLEFASGDRVRRKVLVCHLPLSNNTSTVIVIDVMGDAPKAAVDRLFKQIFRSVVIRR